MTVAFVNNETPFFVISSRILVPSENGPLGVDTRHPPSLKSVVRPTSCIPETASVALTIATNGYLARRVGVKVSDDPNGVSSPGTFLVTLWRPFDLERIIPGYLESWTSFAIL